MASAESSVRVSKETLHELDRLRGVWHTRSAEETIQRLLRERRSKALKALLGSHPKLPKFTEADRLGSHY